MTLELKDQQVLDLFEKINEIHTTVAVIQNDLTYIKEDVKKNTKDLEEHIAGVRACEARIEQESQKVNSIGKRLEKIENSPKRLVKSIVKMGSISAALLAIYEFCKHFFVK